MAGAETISKLRVQPLRSAALAILVLVSVSSTFSAARLTSDQPETFNGPSLASSLAVQTVSGPLAAFTWEPCVTCVVPGDVVFFNGNWSISPSSSIVLYTWDFGDGSPVVNSSGPAVFHVYYGFPGKWLVTLRVQDSAGMTNSVGELVLFNTVPRFVFHPGMPIVGQLVTFNGSRSFAYSGVNPISGFLWDFGDGTAGSGSVVTHAYSSVGFFRVTLSLVTVQGNPAVSKIVRVRLPGDVNGDCVVNFLDVGRVGAAMLKTYGQAGFDPAADLDGDGVVNFADLGIVGANFLRTC